MDVIPYDGCPKPGATIRDAGFYAVFLDFTKIKSTRLLRGVCYHELGHVATGALHRWTALLSWLSAANTGQTAGLQKIT